MYSEAFSKSSSIYCLCHCHCHELLHRRHIGRKSSVRNIVFPTYMPTMQQFMTMTVTMLAKSTIKRRQRPDMVVAVDLDVEHQRKETTLQISNLNINQYETLL